MTRREMLSIAVTITVLLCSGLELYTFVNCVRTKLRRIEWKIMEPSQHVTAEAEIMWYHSPKRDMQLVPRKCDNVMPIIAVALSLSSFNKNTKIFILVLSAIPVH
jgi:hypothetical protein